MSIFSNAKAAIIQLTNTQKAALLFAISVLPPVITWLTSVGSGQAVTVQSGAVLGAAVLGGVLVFCFKMLGDTDSSKKQ